MEFNPDDKELSKEIEREVRSAEEAYEEFGQKSNKIYELMKNLKTYFDKEDWEKLTSILEGISKKIRPLNIIEIKRLMSKVKDASSSIAKREILLFLG